MLPPNCSYGDGAVGVTEGSAMWQSGWQTQLPGAWQGLPAAAFPNWWWQVSHCVQIWPQHPFWQGNRAIITHQSDLAWKVESVYFPGNKGYVIALQTFAMGVWGSHRLVLFGEIWVRSTEWMTNQVDLKVDFYRLETASFPFTSYAIASFICNLEHNCLWETWLFGDNGPYSGSLRSGPRRE